VHQQAWYPTRRDYLLLPVLVYPNPVYPDMERSPSQSQILTVHSPSFDDDGGVSCSACGASWYVLVHARAGTFYMLTVFTVASGVRAPDPDSDIEITGCRGTFRMSRCNNRIYPDYCLGFTPILVLDSSDEDAGPPSRESDANGQRASAVRLS
jgi:hypothetical protein